MTDEDKMIERLTIHKNLIGWIIEELEAEGIEARRTTGNDSSGDVLIVNSEDVPRVKEIVRQIQKEYNP
ncbi:hypothetical protein VKI21_12725 [Cyanobacterium aponinum UTEX 3222]|uniref:hypothetical protein n=1 Tax=Cyanobacterium aponinum TaxID=379064 RepID=UPI00308FE541|nr:hypothetical protein VKI21_12725 [Cyanobacterium aponinum UTEX 3222]